jgi:RNA polymerase sigma-70 factor (ECF subfamily)
MHAFAAHEAAVTTETRDAALRRLASACARRGVAIAFDLLGDRDEAEDAVQESLARACERFGTLRDAGALEGWFYRVLTNLCMRTLRRRRVYLGIRRVIGAGRVVPGDGEGDSDDAPPPPELVADIAPADERLARARDARATLGAVAALPVGQKTALVLRYGHDLGVPEIAAAMGVSEATVKTHLVRGLARLRLAVDPTTTTTKEQR